MSFSIHKDLLVSVHTLVRNSIDSGGSAGNVVIKNASDQTLATMPLTYPCGTVSSTTGRLTISGGVDPDPVLSGTASKGEVQDSDGKVWLTLPAIAGTAPVDDTLVLDSVTITAGYPVELISFTIG